MGRFLTRSLSAALAIAAASASVPVPTFAQVVNPPKVGASSVTMGGDVTGPSGTSTVAKVNGNTPGGSCISPALVQSIDSSGRPTCVTPSGTVSGIGFGSGSPASGLYYGFLGEQYQTGATGASGTARCHTVTPPRTITAKALATWITTLFSGGNLQFALYAATPDGHGATGLPLATTPNISTTSTGGVSGAFASTYTLQANTLYALCAAVDNGSVITSSPTTSTAVQMAGFTSLANVPRSGNAGITGYTYSLAFGTWSDLTGVVPTESIGLVPAAFTQAN